jgi:hypothetical protein
MIDSQSKMNFNYFQLVHISAKDFTAPLHVFYKGSQLNNKG